MNFDYLRDDIEGYGRYRLGQKNYFTVLEKSLDEMWSDKEVQQIAAEAKRGLTPIKEPKVQITI